MTDLISRADALVAVCKWCEHPYCKSKEECGQWIAMTILPSADANPTVVRCKTMIPYGDFREWAKRIREDNPNVIVIPFDAEVVSADAVQGEWIFNGYEKTNKSWFECSVCGSDYFHKHNYCPNCGARMKGGAE